MNQIVLVFIRTAFEINDRELRNVLPNVDLEDLMQKPISLANLVSAVSKYMPLKHEDSQVTKKHDIVT